MKKLYMVGGIVLLGAAVFFFQLQAKWEKRKQIAQAIQTLPRFKITYSDSIEVPFMPIEKKPYVTVYFNTDCDHCQYETTQIQKNMSQFKDSQVLMLSIEPLSNIRKFIKTYRLEGFSNLQVGQITGKTAVETFGFKSVPHILIYNAENQLVKEYKGETKIEAILKYL